MADRQEKLKPVTVLHKDGSLWAKGQKRGEILEGYWEWFRKDGTKMRSGYFVEGEPSGQWITYDKAGKAHKVTQIKPKGGKA